MASTTKARLAGIYCRISEDRYGEALGVARQETDCRKLAKDRGWRVVDVYTDNDLSGSKRSVRRPEFERMLADASAGRIDAVIAWDFDRLTRQPRQLEAFVDECTSAGVQELVTVSDNVNLGTGDGLLVARIKGAVAAEEARKLGQRVARKMLELAENGKPNGGRRPYGFQANRIDHEEQEADALRRATTVVLSGGTLAEAARSTSLRPEVLKRCLLAPRITGLRQHHGEIIGDAVWEPIIERGDWERLRGILGRPSRYSVPYKRHLLTGFVRCGECDHQLSAQVRRHEGGRIIYQCRSQRGGCGLVSVDGAQLKRFVDGEIRQWLRSPKWRRAAQRHLNGGPDVNEKALLAAITDGERRLANLAAEVGELGITTAEWSAMRRPILEQIESARAELGKLGVRPNVRVDIATVVEAWAAGDDDERRGWLRDLGVSVVVAKAAVRGGRFNSDRVTMTPSWA